MPGGVFTFITNADYADNADCFSLKGSAWRGVSFIISNADYADNTDAYGMDAYRV